MTVDYPNFVVWKKQSRLFEKKKVSTDAVTPSPEQSGVQKRINNKIITSTRDLNAMNSKPNTEVRSLLLYDACQK